MSESEPTGLESRHDESGIKRLDDSGIKRLDDRDVRALTERLTVLPNVGDARGADGMYAVVSHSGETYTVDIRLGSCSCPDSRHRDPDGGCKHQRRAEYVTGERSVPSWVDVSAIDDVIGVGVDTPAVAADGGECDDCAALESDWPCATCYVRGEKEIPDNI